ncbi:MAG TPA: hypothetical protein VGK56_05240 [Anaerolineales bacterium]
MNRRLYGDDASEKMRLLCIKQKRHGYGNVRGSLKVESNDLA